jgi:hypothetical protein
MKIFELKLRLERFNDLIKREATGDCDVFAEKMKLKKIQLYEMINEFKDYGADIKYNRERQTYYYANDFVVKIEIYLEVRK